MVLLTSLLLPALSASSADPKKDEEEAGERTHWPDAATAPGGIKLEAGNGCGNSTSYSPISGMAAVTVFKNERPWHDWTSCLIAIAHAMGTVPAGSAYYKFAYNQVLYILESSNTRFFKDGKSTQLKNILTKDGLLDLSKFETVAQVNEAGVPYSSMSQGDFGEAFLTLYKMGHGRAPAVHLQAYKALSAASMNVLLDDSKVGLRTRQRCAQKKVCSWFHGTTDEDRAESKSGATLNKHLSAMRGLYDTAYLLLSAGGLTSQDQKQAAKYIEASVEGANQLVYAKGARKKGDLPNLYDFIPKTEKGDLIGDSWIYYAFSLDKSRGYFLKYRPKNCSYHVYVLHLLSRVLGDTKGLDKGGFKDRPGELKREKKSIVEFLVDTYLRKLKDGGLYKDSDSPRGGDFGACNKDRKPIDKNHLSTLKKY